MHLKVNAFEMWCYADTKDKLEQQSNKKVLKRIQTELNFMKYIIKRKMKYAEHVLRGSSGLSHLQILECRVETKKKVDSPRKT